MIPMVVDIASMVALAALGIIAWVTVVRVLVWRMCNPDNEIDVRPRGTVRPELVDPIGPAACERWRERTWSMRTYRTPAWQAPPPGSPHAPKGSLLDV